MQSWTIRRRRTAHALVILFLFLGVAGAASAALTATPPNVSIFPTQTSGGITVTVVFPQAMGTSGSGSVSVTGLPTGVTTNPANIQYSYTAGQASATTTFSFVAAGGATPGIYKITLDDASLRSGSTSVTLTISSPSFTAISTPNPLTLTIGGAPQSATVSTNPDPGFAPSLQYTFTGLPAFIAFGAPQTVRPPYAPVTFPFSTTGGAVPGIYPGTLVGSYTDASGAPQTRSFPINVIVQQADIAVSFAQPVMSLCSGAAATSNAITLTALSGYSGTPVLSFTSVPPGITLTPLNPGSPALPPAQSVAFTAAAAASVSGIQSVTLTVSDPKFGISKTATLTLNATQPDFTPSVSPIALSLTAGGGGQSFTASIAPNACFGSSTVTVTPRAAQPGIAFTPPSANITGPTASPASFTVSAAAGVPTNTYPISFDFTLGTTTRTASATVAVSPAPDFALALNPAVLSIASGRSGAMTVSATGINGFGGPINVVAPVIAGVAFTPPVFTLLPGGSQSVSVAVASSAATRSTSGQFTGTAAGISGPRTATLVLNILPGPDFTILVSPPSLSIAAGSSSTASVGFTALNGFSGVVAFAVTSPAGLTVTPAAFSVATGSSQAITVSVAPGTPAGPATITFNATAFGVPPHVAAFVVTVTGALDFALSVAPSAVQLVAGGSTTVSVGTTGLNGFNSAISVTAPSIAGLTFTPAAFTVTPGATQSVTIAAAPGVAPGVYSGSFSGTAAGVTGSRTVTLTTTVTVAPDYSLAVTPPILTIAVGQSSTASVAVTALNGFSGSVSVLALPPAGVTVSPPSFTIAAGGTQTITISVSPAAQPGTLTIPLNATGAGAPSHQTSIALNILPAPDFSIAVSPPQLTLAAGDSGAFALSATALNGFAGAISVTMPLLTGVTFTPLVLTLQPGTTQNVGVLALASATPGTFALAFTANAAGIAPPHIAQASLTILPQKPVITSLTPPAVSVGTLSAVVHLSGLHFKPGASITTSAFGVLVDSMNVTSDATADVTLTVTGKAAAGITPLKLTNPDGSSADVGLLVYPTSSLAAPLGVTAAAIVYPRPGTLVGGGQQILAKGLLATTGTGVITGLWKLDGVPFDTFTVPTSGGLPVEITAHVPLPVSFFGDHQLQLEVQNPKQAFSAAVPLVYTERSESELRIIAPADGTVIRGPRELRWSIMPGALGYRVEVEGDRTKLPLRIELGESRLVLKDPAGEWGPGVHRWRVRAMFAANVEGEPTPWRRVAVLPDSVRLLLLPAVQDASSGRTVIRWSGGFSGALYRLELIDPATGETFFSALTAREQYGLPPMKRELPGSTLVRVTAYGPDGAPFGTSGDRPWSALTASLRFGSRFAQALAIPAVSLKQPRENETVRTNLPRVEAKWSAAVPLDQVSLVIDTTDVTGVSSVTPVSVAYDALLPLAAGAHTVHLSAGGALETWNFTVEVSAAASPPAAVTAPEAAPLSARAPEKTSPEKPARRPLLTQSDWVFTPGGTISVVSADNVHGGNAVHATFSSQADVASGLTTAKLNGDIAFRHDLEDPNKTVQESRNWILRPGLQQGNTKEEVIVGYAPPDFLNQAELVTVGLTRGAVEGKVTMPAGTASYYETIDIRPVGVVAGNIGQEQKIRALAYEMPESSKFTLRLVDIRVTEDAGLYSSGGRGEVFGIFGKYAFTPTLNLLAEAAHGKFDPKKVVDEDPRKGNAFRLGLSGAQGTLTWGFGVRHTESQFVNPANRGFTPGGIPDRTGFDMQISKAFARTSLAGQMRLLRDSNASGTIVPQTREINASLTLTQMLTAKTALVAAGTWTHDQGSGTAVLPGADRTQRGLSLTLTEALGKLGLTQVVSRQEMRDRMNALMQQTVTTGMLSVNDPISQFFMLSSFLSATRSEGAPSVGRTDQTMLTLQPSLMLPWLHITLQPRASWINVHTSLFDTSTRTEQYQAIASWAPVWAGSLMSFQLSNDWNRNLITNVPSTGFTQRVAGAVNIHWGTGRGALAPPNAAGTSTAIPR